MTTRTQPLVLGILLGIAAIALVVPYDVIGAVDAAHVRETPSLDHWLGTDTLGRDVAWRLFLSTRSSVPGGVVAAGVAVVLGVPLGIGAGWSPGFVSAVSRQVVDVVSAVPRLVAVLFACMIAGDGRWIGAVATGIAVAPALARSVEARLVDLRDAEFVVALRAYGIAPLRILGLHVLWANCRGLIAREAIHALGTWLVIEATLSYLGAYGVPEPEPSWGNMIAMAFSAPPGNPWAGLAPACALAAVAIGLHVAGSRDG